MLLLIPSFLQAQDIFCSVPLEGNKLKDQDFYDTDDYALLIHHFPSADYMYLLKKGSGVVGSHKVVAYTDYRGYTSTESSFIVYYLYMKKISALIFDKATGKVTVEKELEVPGLRSGDKQYIEFTYQHKFHRIYLNKKSQDMSVYVFEGASAKQIANMPVTSDILKNDDEYVKFLSGSRPIDVNSFDVDRQLYWQGDSLIFSYPIDKKRVLISCNLVSRKISSQSIPTPKVMYLDHMLVGDKLFVKTVDSYARSTSFDDSLQIRVFDTKKNLALVKTLTGNSITGIRWKTTPYISSLGDTVENEWLGKKKIVNLVNEVQIGFMYSVRSGDGTYAMTLGYQTSTTSGGSPSGPGGPMVYNTTLGPINSFRTCLSADFQPMRCTQMDGYENAVARTYALRQERKTSGKKGRFDDFAIKRFPNCVYLVYIDKEKETYNVERFLYP